MAVLYFNGPFRVGETLSSSSAKQLFSECVLNCTLLPTGDGDSGPVYAVVGSCGA